MKTTAENLLSKCVANKFTSARFQEIFNVLFSVKETKNKQKFNTDDKVLERIKSGFRVILQSEGAVPDFGGPWKSFGKGHPLCR